MMIKEFKTITFKELVIHALYSINNNNNINSYKETFAYNHDDNNYDYTITSLNKYRKQEKELIEYLLSVERIQND